MTLRTMHAVIMATATIKALGVLLRINDMMEGADASATGSCSPQ